MYKLVIWCSSQLHSDIKNKLKKELLNNLFCVKKRRADGDGVMVATSYKQDNSHDKHANI